GDGTWEDHEVTRTELCLDESTGYLERTRRLASGVTRGVNDVIVANTADADGNTTQTRSFGGDVQAVGTGPLCEVPLTGAQYDIRRLHSSGTLSLAYYDNGSGGQVGSFFLSDDDIDAATGLVTASRDVSGRQTDYSYDLLGRITWITPQEPNQAWTEVVYSAATSSSPAQATVIQYPHGQTSGALARHRYRYDGLGRLASE
ncbi:MAG: RHS repeat protein, partial [bacterium]|nr:RHS repeat protein [bacterium]